MDRESWSRAAVIPKSLKDIKIMIVASIESLEDERLMVLDDDLPDWEDSPEGNELFVLKEMLNTYKFLDSSKAK